MTGEKAKYGLFVDGVIRNTECRFLIDTGSSDTVVSSSVYHRIPREQRPTLQTESLKIEQVDGSPLAAVGAAWVEIQIGKSVAAVKVIFADMPYSGILGMNFLLSTGASLDLQTLQLRLNGEQIQCTTSSGEPFVGRVVVTETKVIPSGHEAVVPGAIRRLCEVVPGPVLIEPVEGGGELAQRGLILARSLVESDQEVLPLRVLNPNREKRVVRQGTTIGIVSQVEIDQGQSTPSGGREADQELPEHLQDLFERSVKFLREEDHHMVERCLSDYQDVFSRDDRDIGRTDVVKHSINTNDAKPVKERLRRYPKGDQEEIMRQVRDLEGRGLIEPSDSPWAANVVLVRKKDGARRLCVDYRGLNARTIKDAYPVPRIDETLDELGGSRWFSTLDLASGYWQVALDEDASQKSSFVVRNGLYRWKCMPFGLCNAPATFERLMDKVMAGLQWEILLIYLDDVIVFGKTVEEEIRRLRVVFERLRKAGLKLKPSKCSLFQRSVKYLGHIVSAEGVATDPEKVSAVADWPVPKCVKEVRSFIGLASYYRKFIQGFAEIASPLHELTSKSREFLWTDKCQRAFEELKQRLQSSPILAYPLAIGDYVLDTDASGDGIGAVLSQVQDGEEKVVAYASRKLSKAERNYCVTRRELLAVVVYLKHFRQYLYGRKITVRTDHAALRWLLNFKDPEGQLARWLQVVSEYDVTVQHRPGRKHGNADCLSRRQCKQCGRGGDPGKVSGTVEAGEGSVDPKESVTEVSEVVGSAVRGILAKPGVSQEDVRNAQMADPCFKWLIELKESGSGWPDWVEVSHTSKTRKTLWSMWGQLEVRNRLLSRRWESDDGKSIRWQLVLPEEYRRDVVNELHGGSAGGHLGLRKTLAKVKLRYYWPGMTADVRSHLRCCELCQRRKSPSKRRVAPLQQYRVGAPVERVALDLLGPLPRSDSGNVWVLVVGDYCSKWMEAFPLPDAKAETVAAKFVSEFVCRFGVPQELHSDQGTNFESAVFAEMCRLLGIRKTRTTAYNPKSDGMVERFNKTLVNIVSMLIEPKRKQRDWDECLPFATFAYRCSPQESTGETPNMMMLGREVMLPVDLMVECPEIEDAVETDFALGLRQRLQEAHSRASECLKQSIRRQKRNYDRKVSGGGLEEGQFVWLFDRSRKRGVSPKLQLRWRGPYLVVKKLSEVTYRIQLKRGSKPFVVHADRLKPYCGDKPQPWVYQPGTVTENSGGDAPEIAEVQSAAGDKEEPGGEESMLILETSQEEPEVTGSEPQVEVREAEVPRRYPRREHRLPVRYR